MFRRVALLVNRGSGGLSGPEADTRTRTILDLISAYKFDLCCFVEIDSGSSLKEKCGAMLADSPEVVVVAGGDGTINYAASLLLGTSSALAPLPCGTFNLFCRSLGLSLEIRQAFHHMFSGSVKQVDVATLNDQVFLVDSIVGLYPKFVWEFESERNASTVASRIFSAFRLLMEFSPEAVEIQTDGGEKSPLISPMVIISPNSFDLSKLPPVRRIQEPPGLLEVQRVTTEQRAKLLMDFFKAAREDGSKIIETEASWHREVTITSANKDLYVSLDGEALKMSPPLTYRCLPKALRVLMP